MQSGSFLKIKHPKMGRYEDSQFFRINVFQMDIALLKTQKFLKIKPLTP